jgi:hypothetical protein
MAKEVVAVMVQEARSIFMRKIVQGKNETTIEQTSKDFEEYGS